MRLVIASDHAGWVPKGAIVDPVTPVSDPWQAARLEIEDEAFRRRADKRHAMAPEA